MRTALNVWVTLGADLYASPEGWQVFFFFFSSRRRHTRCSRDWSSDVCSSDLLGPSNVKNEAISDLAFAYTEVYEPKDAVPYFRGLAQTRSMFLIGMRKLADRYRSEERRVGKECRSRWRPEHQEEKQPKDYTIR